MASPAAPNTVFGINILLHVFVLFTFLVVFYIVVVTKLETDAIHHQVKRALDSNLKLAFASADMTTDGQFKSAVQALDSVGVLDRLTIAFSVPDPANTEANKGLFQTAISACIALFLVIATFVFALSWLCKKKVYFPALLRENFIVFGLVGLVEILFFLAIALSFVPEVPSTLLKSIVDSFQKHVKAAAS